MQIITIFSFTRLVFGFFIFLIVTNLCPDAVLAIWPTYGEEQERLQLLATKISVKQDTLSECVVSLGALVDAPLEKKLTLLPTVRRLFVETGLVSGTFFNPEVILPAAHQKQLLDEFGAYFFTLEKIIKTLVIYENAWKLYQGPEISPNSPEGSYAGYLSGVHLFVKAYAFRRCSLLVHLFNLGKNAHHPEDGFCAQEEGLLPIAQDVMKITSIDFHPQLQNKLRDFHVCCQQTINDLAKHPNISSSVPTLHLLEPYLRLPERLELNKENPVKEEYENIYRLQAAFSLKFLESQEKNPSQREKLILFIMQIYDGFWNAGLEGKAREWERLNLQPMSEHEYQQSVSAILRQPTTVDG